ncbi:hypothetical protein GNX71_11990 [Variovorax sp. RKNM96]|uniref:hypothetical protein n=1 Tax=Variovorax sp. RKNM96 TaxID=2681552 RepID=UPI00197F88B1|nr:hypothetical protein [Variovorax sp. RKNM96]QSI30266.1 hypothetical protein GNX71_11990 [Variovorax sp. RKNM96]
MNQELPPDFLAVLHEPVLHEDDLDAQERFFGRDAVRAFYREAVREDARDAVLRAAAPLLSELHPLRGGLLALFGGALVESGADPRLLFPATLQRMSQLLASLAPYCAEEPMEEEEEEKEDEAVPADLAAWRAAESALRALPPAERLQIEARRCAVDLLVLPLMAMLMRDVRNHRDLLADGALVARIEEMAVNGTLPFDQLHFLRSAAQLAYEDELVVLLPTSQAGMIVRAHGLNNNFHAFSLLQDLFRLHVHTLGIRQALTVRHNGEDEYGEPRDSDSAEYLWLQATAYAGGKLVAPMAWSWGEGTLRENARRQGQLVLVALETDDKPARSWNGFGHVLHSEQKPHVALVRFLAPDEVAAYLA